MRPRVIAKSRSYKLQPTIDEEHGKNSKLTRLIMIAAKNGEETLSESCNEPHIGSGPENLLFSPTAYYDISQ